MTLVEHKVRVRPAAAGRLAYGGYMVLSWSDECPGTVRLLDLEDGEVEFSRRLLLDALDGEPSAEGPVSARLCCLRGAPHAMILLSVPAADGLPADLAICDTAARDFVLETTGAVPAGEEWRLMPDTCAELVGEAA